VEITTNPKPHDDEVEFILEALSDYLTVQVLFTEIFSKTHRKFSGKFRENSWKIGET
jgi:hypothetical protein